MARKHLRYATALTPASTSSTTFIVEGLDVREVVSGPLPSEEVVFHGHDCGSAHAVADALARYRATGVAPAYSGIHQYPVHREGRPGLRLSA